MSAKWEYRAWSITNDIEKVNQTMAEWAAAGWELVSGNATAYVVDIIHINYLYTQYWRRPIPTKG